MKGKSIISIGLTLLSVLIVSQVAIVQAAQPMEKMVFTDHRDDYFGDLYAKGINHVTIIIKDELEGAYEAVYNGLQQFRLYEVIDSELGNLVAILKIQMKYVGTLELEEPEGFIPLTGKMILTWVLNIFGDITLPDIEPHGHWVIWYENGDIVKEKGFGEPFF